MSVHAWLEHEHEYAKQWHHSQAGYFDPLDTVKESSIPPDAVGTAASHALAKDAALQGMVLLRNAVPVGGAAPALPLRRGVRTAVIGPLANVTLMMMARYYDAVCAGPLNTHLPWGHGERPSQCIESPLHRIMARAGNGMVTHASGYDCPTDRPGDHCLASNSHAGFPAAIAAAAAAEQVVVFVGMDTSKSTPRHVQWNDGRGGRVRPPALTRRGHDLNALMLALLFLGFLLCRPGERGDGSTGAHAAGSAARPPRGCATIDQAGGPGHRHRDEWWGGRHGLCRGQ